MDSRLSESVVGHASDNLFLGDGDEGLPVILGRVLSGKFWQSGQVRFGSGHKEPLKE